MRLSSETYMLLHRPSTTTSVLNQEKMANYAISPKPRRDDISIHEGVRLHQLRAIHLDTSRCGLLLNNPIMPHGHRDFLIAIAHNAEFSPGGDFVR